MASEIFAEILSRLNRRMDREGRHILLFLDNAPLSPQLAYRPLLEYEDGLSVKKTTLPTQPLMLELSETSESENKGKAIVQQDRRTENSELNCQVCQYANGYTMGQTSLGFNQLPATATNLIITPPRTSCIYFLLKIHKPNNPGRPIVPTCSCPTELISILLDTIVVPVVRSLPLKTVDMHFKILRDFIFLGEDRLIVAEDITSAWLN